MTIFLGGMTIFLGRHLPFFGIYQPVGTYLFEHRRKALRQYRMNRILSGLAICLIMAAVISNTACSKAKAINPNTEPPPTVVEVINVEQKEVPIYSEWIGTLDGMVNAQIKTQVSGNILSKNYTEGAFVRKGELLFQLDPRTFEGNLAQAKGELAKAENQLTQAQGQLLQAQAHVGEVEANLTKVEMDLKRAEPLVQNGIIPQRDVDNTVQAYRANEAQVKVAKAAVETAKAGVASAQSAVEAAKGVVSVATLNLSFTKITAPIDGIAGIAQAQVGDFVNVNNPNAAPLTTVTTVDPIKVYFNITEQEYLKNRANSSSPAASDNLELNMILADGSTYGHKGKFYVADSKVDQRTGAIRMAGIFPNPGNLLRPGQYAKVRAITSNKSSALLIPQRAVTELQGRFQVAVVGADHKVEIRTVTVGERVGQMWVINQGLSVGESVVAEGTQKVKAGTNVTTKPFTSTEPAKQ